MFIVIDCTRYESVYLKGKRSVLLAIVAMITTSTVIVRLRAILLYIVVLTLLPGMILH